MLSRKLSYLMAAMALTVGVGTGLVIAADPPVAPTQERAYGSQLMTPQERAEHRAKIRAAKTIEEKARIRAEEHALMQQRAEQQGKTLPENPPVPGAGAGMRGGGTGGGMGAGMGGGRNR